MVFCWHTDATEGNEEPWGELLIAPSILWKIVDSCLQDGCRSQAV